MEIESVEKILSSRAKEGESREGKDEIFSEVSKGTILSCFIFVFASSFLDKIYCLSSEAALKSFRDDPRFYIAPPQPLVPCKIAVVGPHLSGKTTLARALAEHYNAKVQKIEGRMQFT